MISDNLNKHFKNIEDILNKIGERIEGNLICDVDTSNSTIARNLDKIKNLQYLVKNKNKVCEIGVNAGHSLLLMLEENSTADYLIFDLNNHQYTQPCVDYIKGSYPNTNIEVVYGDSKVKVLEHLMNNPDLKYKFDLIHIDGGHGIDEVVCDYNSTKFLSKDNCIFIFDDYDYPGIQKFIDDKLLNNEIKRVEDDNVINTNLHYIYNLV
jgi:predicted O-methyltransferase YrrM